MTTIHFAHNAESLTAHASPTGFSNSINAEVSKLPSNQKSCCIRDGCGMPFNPNEPETRDISTLRAFWYKYCPKHRADVPGRPVITEQKPGTQLDIRETELHTWFERDRAHVDLRDKRDDKTIVEWWDEAVGEAVEDGFLDRKDFHSSAYEYAKDRDMLPRVPRHYIAGSGSYGCLYDQSSVHESYADAVSALSDLFELGRIRRAKLNRDGHLELNTRKDGANYCEVTTCHCGNPTDHQD